MKPPSFRRTALKENNISIIGMKDLAPGLNGFGVESRASIV